MRVEALAIRNYRLFKEARFGALPGMCVVVGENGTGKSALFDVFGFLHDALIHNVARLSRSEATSRRSSAAAQKGRSLSRSNSASLPGLW